MEVIGLQVFVSLMLVVSSLILFARSWKSRDFDHADRLALFPLEDGDTKPSVRTAAPASPTSQEGQS